MQQFPGQVVTKLVKAWRSSPHYEIQHFDESAVQACHRELLKQVMVDDGSVWITIVKLPVLTDSDFYRSQYCGYMGLSCTIDDLNTIRNQALYYPVQLPESKQYLLIYSDGKGAIEVRTQN